MSLFALLGSGEFEPWSASVDRWLLERATGDGRVLVIPTASAAEGDSVFEMWATKGLSHYEGIGISAEVVPLHTRADADRSELADMLAGASVAYFSGGNPAYLAAVLRDSVFWRALTAERARGMAYAGCSAGVACLGDLAPDSASGTFDQDTWKPGLGVFPGIWFGPHWDALDSFVPGIVDFIVSSVPPGETLLGIDEETALLGFDDVWTVEGTAGVHRYRDGAWVHHVPGETVSVP
jgi:cyanophycinase-like exopeptidase